MRSRDHDGHEPTADGSPGAGFELPPGATFEPDPQAGMAFVARANKHAL
jgi:putative (di)nucleoside polyphosphate hydrolase